MRFISPRWRLCLALMFGLASTSSLSAMARRPNGAVPFPVAPGHPYAEAFATFNRLSPEERAAVASPEAAATLSPAVREARKEIELALAEGRGFPPQWQAEHDPLLPGYDPDFLKSLASLTAARISAAALAGDPAARDGAALDVLALLQSTGPGLAAEEWSRQQELILGALSRLQERDTARSPAEATALAAALRALPPPTSFADMVRADPTWRSPGEKLRRALEREACALGLRPERIGAGALRMTGFVIEPGRSAVALETPAGAFWLEQGKTDGGMTLLELDEGKRLARILFEDREATIELTSRRIERWDDAVLDRATRSLIDKSDILFAVLLERKRGTLSEHLDRVDAFARETAVLWAEAAEDPAGLATPELQADRAERLRALAPWPEFDGQSVVKEVLNYHGQGQATEAAWKKTLDLLDQEAKAGL